MSVHYPREVYYEIYHEYRWSQIDATTILMLWPQKTNTKKPRIRCRRIQLKITSRKIHISHFLKFVKN